MHDVWKERKTTFGNIRGGRFGKAIAISTMVAGGPILDFVATPVDVRVAISEILITSNGVRTNVSIHDWHIDKLNLVDPPLSLVSPSREGKVPFFDFFAQGRFIAAQAEVDMIGIFMCSKTTSRLPMSTVSKSWGHPVYFMAFRKKVL